MQIVLGKLKQSELKLIIELSTEELENYRKRTAEDLNQRLTIPGFRAGKAPMEMVIQHVGEQAFMSQVLDTALSESYAQALTEKKIRPVAYPKVSILSHEPLKYEALVTVVPEVSFKKDISTVSVKAQEPEVKEEEIQEVLENFVRRTIEWKDVQRPTKKDDRVEIDFDGQDMQGVPLEGTSSKNHPVVLGSGQLIPGFEEEIEGMNLGEEKEFEITFPKDYPKASFQSKNVKFKVKVNRVEEGQAQAISDELAKKVSGDEQKTLTKLKEEIHLELKKHKGRQEDLRREEEFLKQVLGIVEAEIPELLIEREIDFMVERIKEDLKKKKRSWEDYEKELKEAGKDLRAELKKPATEQVLLRLALERLFELENPQMTEAEVDEEVEAVLSNYPEEFRLMMKERYQEGTEAREGVKQNLRLKKIVQAHTK